jgi:hypothetical protein
MKQCSVVDTKTVRSLQFQVVLFLSLIFCKQEEKLLFILGRKPKIRLHQNPTKIDMTQTFHSIAMEPSHDAYGGHPIF